MYDHRLALTEQLSQLCQSRLTKILPKGVGEPATSYHDTQASEQGPHSGERSGGALQTTAAAASEAKLHHLIFLASAAHSCLRSTPWEGSRASHLLLEAASAAPFLLWLHPHSMATFTSCSLSHLSLRLGGVSWPGF